MSNPSQDGYNPTAEQQQNMDNLSFDREFRQNTVENLVYNETTNKLDRMVQPGEMLPTSGLNASVDITEVIAGTVTTKTITKTINGTNYVKTVATDSSDNSVTISTWA